MRTLSLAFALAAGLAGIAGASAQTAPPPPGPRGMAGSLMAADANGDGTITREEATASSDAMFDRMDANHDGVITPDERRAARDAMRPGGTAPGGGAAPPPPAGAPGTAGGGLTRQQWRDRALRQFDRIDVNHDGRIDRTEIANYMEAMRERRMERQATGDGAPPSAPAGEPGQ